MDCSGKMTCEPRPKPTTAMRLSGFIRASWSMVSLTASTMAAARLSGPLALFIEIEVSRMSTTSEGTGLSPAMVPPEESAEKVTVKLSPICCGLTGSPELRSIFSKPTVRTVLSVLMRPISEVSSGSPMCVP